MYRLLKFASAISIAVTLCNMLPAAEKPLLKVAVLSDIQHYDQPGDWAYGNFEKALAMLKTQSPEAMIIAGDLVENATSPDAFKSYRSLINKYFPDRPLPLVICAGNHDVHSTPVRPLENMLKLFCDNLAIPHDNPLLQFIGGYAFITVHDAREKEFADSTLQKLKTLLDKAAAFDQQKPIFVVTHYPPANTVIASQPDRMSKLRQILNNYPQVVSLSGHTHYPLEDERCIWQKEFTALTTSTLSYGCMADCDLFNVCNGILPFAREVVQMMMMEIYPNKVIFYRYNVEEKREIKPHARWLLTLPYRPAEARYTAQRAQQRQAPEFPADAKLFIRYDYGFAYVIFDRAQHNDMVQYYLVKTAEQLPNGQYAELGTVKYAADFYRLNRNRDPREFFKLPAGILKAGCVNQIEVYPMETFGKMGKPLVLQYPVPHWWQFKAFSPKSAPQE